MDGWTRGRAGVEGVARGLRPSSPICAWRGVGVGVGIGIVARPKGGWDKVRKGRRVGSGWEGDERSVGRADWRAGGSGPFGDATARCRVLSAVLCALDAYLGVSAAYVGYVRAYRRDLMREGR